jgi:hypothetical protein
MMAVSATVGFARKLYARHRHGTEIPLILHDPPEIRTLARFELTDAQRTRDLLTTLASALAPDIDDWVIEGDCVRARRAGLTHHVDVLRLVDRGGKLYTLELTRAWTGPDLGEPTRSLLLRLHDVLAADDDVRALAWHQRQDRELATAHRRPVAPTLATT